MVWVRFLANYSYKPRPQVTQDFRGGTYCDVTAACRDAAIAAGRAVEEEPPPPKPRAAVKLRKKQVHY